MEGAQAEADSLEKTVKRMPELSTVVSHLTANSEEMDKVLQAGVRLLWVLDRPNRGKPTLKEAATGLFGDSLHLQDVRETIKASILRRQRASGL